MRYVFKRSVAAIVPEAHGSPFVGFRRAIRFAFPVERAIQICFRRPLYIISDDEVEAAVLIVVDPSSAAAEFLRTEQACFLRNVREGAVTVVVKQVVLTVGGDEKIVVAVVVVVAHGHAHSKKFHVQACFMRHVGECAVMIVVVQLWRGMLLNVTRPVHPVDKKNVRPAVIVVVNERDARPHGLGQKFLTKRAIVVNKANAGLLRNVVKLDQSRFRGCSDSCLCDEKRFQQENKSNR